mmetsp:Transcript_14550/g.34706  ORF Transcript_14550/g.34706 Transcript_14550/m.34706 type:complete len:89 (-) Transcript_14550:118-384(-)
MRSLTWAQREVQAIVTEPTKTSVVLLEPASFPHESSFLASLTKIWCKIYLFSCDQHERQRQVQPERCRQLLRGGSAESRSQHVSIALA